MRSTTRLGAMALVVLAASALCTSTASADTTTDEAQFVTSINVVRTSKGLRPLAPDGQLISVARAWSSQMAGAATLSHNPALATQVSDWRTIGENVGTGLSVQSIEAAFEASPHHYANMIDPSFEYVGVGVVDAGGTLWVTEDFKQSKSGLPTATVPKAAPPPAAPRAPAPARAVAPSAPHAPAPRIQQGAGATPAAPSATPQAGTPHSGTPGVAPNAPAVLAERTPARLPLGTASTTRVLDGQRAGALAAFAALAAAVFAVNRVRVAHGAGRRDRRWSGLRPRPPDA